MIDDYLITSLKNNTSALTSLTIVPILAAQPNFIEFIEALRGFPFLREIKLINSPPHNTIKNFEHTLEENLKILLTTLCSLPILDTIEVDFGFSNIEFESKAEHFFTIVCESLKDLPHLNTFVVEKGLQMANEKHLITLCDALLACDNLQSLDLSKASDADLYPLNYLSPSKQNILNNFLKAKNLKEINLSNAYPINSIQCNQDVDEAFLVNVLNQVTTVEYLHISANQIQNFSDKTLARLQVFLANLYQLQYLNLSSMGNWTNRAPVPDICLTCYIFSQLITTSSLKGLDISNNVFFEFSNNKADVFTMVELFSSLEILRIHNIGIEQLNNFQFKKFCNVLTKLNNLEILDMGNFSIADISSKKTNELIAALIGHPSLARVKLVDDIFEVLLESNHLTRIQTINKALDEFDVPSALMNVVKQYAYPYEDTQVLIESISQQNMLFTYSQHDSYLPLEKDEARDKIEVTDEESLIDSASSSSEITVANTVNIERENKVLKNQNENLFYVLTEQRNVIANKDAEINGHLKEIANVLQKRNAPDEEDSMENLKRNKLN